MLVWSWSKKLDPDDTEIITLWNDGYSFVPATRKEYDSFVHAILQSKEVIRESTEENNGRKEDDGDDTRREFDTALDKDNCCTDFRSVKKRMVMQITTKDTIA